MSHFCDWACVPVWLPLPLSLPSPTFLWETVMSGIKGWSARHSPFYFLQSPWILQQKFVHDNIPTTHLNASLFFFFFFFLQLDPPSRYWIGFSQPACRTLICLLQTICLRTQIEEAAPLPRVFMHDADACRLARTEASLTCSQVSEMKSFMENVVVLLMLLPLPVEAVTYGSHHAQTRQSTMWLRSCMFTRFSLSLKHQWLNANKEQQCNSKLRPIVVRIVTSDFAFVICAVVKS